MSFERLPLALALSITIIAGGLYLGNGSANAMPQKEGRTSSFGYNLDISNTILLASKDSDAESADSLEKDAKGTSKEKLETAKEEKSIARKSKSANSKTDKSSKIEKSNEEEKSGKEGKETASKDDQNSKDGKETRNSKKASSEGRSSKGKKALKAEKVSAKEISEEGNDKKKSKSGFFHKHNVDEEQSQVESAPETKSTAKSKILQEQDATSKTEAKAMPVFVPDDALISVLKDISRALADGQTEQVQKIENVNERMILGLAEEILTRGLTEPNLTANRIVPKNEEYEAKTSLTAESWSSGDVVVSDKLRGSIAVVWAKRIGGFLTVTIAGDAGQRKTPDGIPIGQFMVVITAHSPVQRGFDIQSQSDVTFWMGRLNSITVEAACVPSTDTANSSDKPEESSQASTVNSTSPSPGGGEVKKKPIVSLSPLLTNRYRKHFEILLAADRESRQVAAQLAAAADPDNDKSTDTVTDEEGKAATSTDRPPAIAGEGPAAKEASRNEDSRKESAVAKGEEAKTDTGAGGGKNIAMTVASDKTAAMNSTNTAATVVANSAPLFRLPSASSTLLMPERALAGQYVTVALLDRSRSPEVNVELSFNGASLSTNISGQAIYQIPDDTTPGRSLNIALSARPDEVPATIEVLQPLNVTTGQPPRLDRMTPLAIKESIITVDGHNFDGIAHNNSVIVDGSLEGHIVSASPYQLKLLLPQGLRPGSHSLCVSTDGMRSNLAGFDYADTLVTVDGKDTGKENSNVKLLVKVIGTTAKMNVKILNQTPDIIRLNRGAEITVTSSGGFDNSIQLPAVRAKKGTFSIDTQIEM